MCLVSVVVAIIEFCLNVSAATFDNHAYYDPARLCYYYDVVSYTFEQNVNHRGTVAVDALLCCFAGLEGIVAGIAAFLTCHVCCWTHEYKQFDTPSVQTGAFVYTSHGSPGKQQMHITRDS
jgi:hypothetical protein